MIDNLVLVDKYEQMQNFLMVIIQNLQRIYTEVPVTLQERLNIVQSIIPLYQMVFSTQYEISSVLGNKETVNLFEMVKHLQQQQQQQQQQRISDTVNSDVLGKDIPIKLIVEEK